MLVVTLHRGRRALIVACIACVAGCATTPSVSTSAAAEGVDGGLPRVTALYEKAMQPRVHEFRRPNRDERERLLRALATECDRLLADVQTWRSTATLTAGGDAPQAKTEREVTSLADSLAALRDAAKAGDNEAMHHAYGNATAAYAQLSDTIPLK